MRELNLDQVAALREVVRLGSFTAAAQSMNLTQPAVTQKIRALEGRFGLGLVRTLGKRTTATDHGRQLLARTLPLLQEAQAIELEMRGAREDAVQPVSIGIGATACIHLLPPILKDLKRRLPRAEPIVQTGNTSKILERVARGDTDLALVTGPVKAGTLETVLFARDPLVLVAPSGLALPKRVTSARLPDLPRILYERHSATAALIAVWLAHHPEPQGFEEAMELDSTEAIKRLIQVGLGWSILPQLCVATAAERRKLAVRELHPRLHRTLYLVRAKGQARNPAVDSVWAELVSRRASS